MPSFAQDTATSVYRYYDEHCVLLYVGVTSRATSRQREHNDDKVWWPFVGSQQVDHFDTRPEALLRESELIREFRPPFNTQQNPGYLKTREAYLLFRAACENDPTSSKGGRLNFLQHSQDEDGKNTILRSAAIIDPGQIQLNPQTKVNSDRRKYGLILKAWQQGPFIMLRLQGQMPPILSAWCRLKAVQKPRGIRIDNLFVVPEYHTPTKPHNRPNSWSRVAR